MNRTVYVNGEYVSEQDAKISVFDRGFLFADGVYEVSCVLQGELIENDLHIKRLNRSMNELNMRSPLTDDEIKDVQKELIKRNELQEGLVYLQVTRGAEDRSFTWSDDIKPSIVIFTQTSRLIDSPIAERGISVVTTPDIRWERRDIKTTGLLASCLAKMIARKAGADDAWLVDGDGFITEGSSNNAYILNEDDTIVTRNLTNSILHGITRKVVLEHAAKANLKIEERPFTIAEALNAREAFITSASTFVWPVISIDEQAIGDGKPGAVAKNLRKIYIETALADINR